MENLMKAKLAYVNTSFIDIFISTLLVAYTDRHARIWEKMIKTLHKSWQRFPRESDKGAEI